MNPLLCQECMLYVVNGDVPIEDTAEWRERVEAHGDGKPGHWVMTCDSEEFETDDEELLHRHFDNSPCAMCGTQLAGNRCPFEWRPIDQATTA